MELLIRELEESDIKALTEIEQKSFSMPWSEQDFKDLLTRSYCIYLVALVDGKVVGSAGMTDICDEGNIDNVVVDEDYRGQGIGSKLISKLIELGRERGIKAFTLEVRVSNARAIHVYEKFGFMSVGIRPGFYDRPKEDAEIMWLR